MIPPGSEPRPTCPLCGSAIPDGSDRCVSCPPFEAPPGPRIPPSPDLEWDIATKPQALHSRWRAGGWIAFAGTLLVLSILIVLASRYPGEAGLLGVFLLVGMVAVPIALVALYRWMNGRRSIVDPGTKMRRLRPMTAWEMSGAYLWGMFLSVWILAVLIAGIAIAFFLICTFLLS